VKSETRSFYETAVDRTVARIVATLDEALDLGALAREAALSPFHFHRVFRGMVGETPLELHRRLRLERAAWELLAGRAAVTRSPFPAANRGRRVGRVSLEVVSASRSASDPG
jgi:AraC family transcriptional regulator